MTLGIDLGSIKPSCPMLRPFMASLPIEPVALARIALERLGLVGKGNERDRRPTEDELDRLSPISTQRFSTSR